MQFSLSNVDHDQNFGIYLCKASSSYNSFWKVTCGFNVADESLRMIFLCVNGWAHSEKINRNVNKNEFLNLDLWNEIDAEDKPLITFEERETIQPICEDFEDIPILKTRLHLTCLKIKQP